MMNRNKPLFRAAGQFFLYSLLFLSGVAGLGYEIVWTRMFALGLGHEMPSMLAVLAAFFGGLALGAWGLDRLVSTSPVPGRWYAALEVIIGIWALVTIILVPSANSLVASLLGVTPGPLRHWAVAFAIPFVTLLPATVAMGATLSAMDRLLCRWRDDGRSLGGLYAANTLGAVFGVVAATFFCVPWLGYRTTLTVFSTLNFSCALGAATLFGRAFATNPGEKNGTVSPPKIRLDISLFVTGLLGIGYEVLAVRVMAQVLENTVYSFAAALVVYLFGTATGGAIYQARARVRPFEKLLSFLLVALCISCMFGVVVLSMSRWLYGGLSLSFGQSLAGAVAAEMGLAVLVFGLPTCLMGATFCHLAQASRGPTSGVGRALAVNTLGGAFAPLVFAVWLLPVLGAKWALMLLAAVYLTLIPRLEQEFAVAGIPVILFLLLPTNLVLVQPIGGGQIVEYHEGVMAAVAVVTDDGGERYLKVNDRFRMGGTAARFGESRQGHIPLLLHPAPKSALFLGLGTGATFASSAVHPDLKSEAVELVPEVVDVLPYFQPNANDSSATEQESIFVADARRFVAVSPKQYDVIVADLFHPARDESGMLYTTEHFSAVRQRLNAEGVFCQWLPLYQMDLDTLKVIVRTFLNVFPNTRAYLLHFNVEMPAIGLIASTGPVEYGPGWIEQREADASLSDALKNAGLQDDLSLFGCLLALPDELRAFTEGIPVNTDNHPLVNFYAPRFAYGQKQPAYHTLEMLLDLFEPKADSLVGDQEFRQRLTEYIAARNLYLDAEMCRVDGRTELAVDGYLASIRRCPEFRIGYIMGVAIAQNHAQSGDFTTAERILAQLIDADPSRSEATQLQDLIRRNR